MAPCCSRSTGSRRHQRGSRSAAATVVLLLALGGLSAAAGERQTARRLKQVTFFYDTPLAAGSTSVDVNGNAAVRPDGTIHAAVGGAITSADGVANPFLPTLTRGAYKNRPKAASAAYTQIPLLLQQTLFPSLSYGLAEGSGDAFSLSNGAWGNLELGYNPISNNLGASISAGTANSVNTGSGEEFGSLNPGSGKSGIEFAGTANDETNLADARTAQTGQVVAGPNNIANPFNPLTCTQALLYAVTLTSYDLGAPAGPLPRENPPSIVPFCLTLFNFGTLDDFSNFVDENSDQLFDPQGNAVTATDLTAPPVEGTAGNVFSDGTVSTPGVIPVPAAGGAAGGGAAAGDAAGGGAAGGGAARSSTPRRGSNSGPGIAEADNRNAELRQQAAALGLTPSERQGADKQAKPVMRSGALRGAYDNSLGNGKPIGKVRSFEDAVKKAVDNSSPEIKAFAETPFGKMMLGQITTGSLAQFVDGTDKILRDATETTINQFSEPISNFTTSLSNFTAGAVYNATNLGLKAAVAGLETLEPAVKLGVGFNQKAYQPAAKASREAAAKLQADSQAKLMASVQQMPDGKEKQQLMQSVQQLNKPKQLLAPEDESQGQRRRRSLLSFFKLW